MPLWGRKVEKCWRPLFDLFLPRTQNIFPISDAPLLGHPPVDGNDREVLLHQELGQGNATLHRPHMNHYVCVCVYVRGGAVGENEGMWVPRQAALKLPEPTATLEHGPPPEGPGCTPQTGTGTRPKTPRALQPETPGPSATLQWAGTSPRILGAQHHPLARWHQPHKPVSRHQPRSPAAVQQQFWD